MKYLHWSSVYCFVFWCWWFFLFLFCSHYTIFTHSRAVQYLMLNEAEFPRIDTSELWCWRRFLSVPWTARRSNQSILQEINPEIYIVRTDAETETPNTLATWCKKLSPWKRPWCWERLNSGGEGDNRGLDSWMASLTHSMFMSLSKFGELVIVREVWHVAVYEVTKSQTWLSDWTQLNWTWDNYTLKP